MAEEEAAVAEVERRLGTSKPQLKPHRIYLGS